jgi:hypothetical protein
MRALGAMLFTALAACTAIEPYPSVTLEQCANGIDDDLNGLVDLADPACTVFGADCSGDASLCTPHGLSCSASHRCGASCDASHACTSGWTCTTDVCDCTPCVERCNGVDDDCDGHLDESTCATGERCDAAHRACVCDGTTYYLRDAHESKLDLLFVLDDSSSIIGLRQALIAELPNAVRGLATGDIDGDGVRDGAPIDSIHLGVVIPELGVPVGLPGCLGGNGDDGVLSAGSNCSADTTPVFQFEALTDSPTTFARDATCALTFPPGTGCGLPQVLETALKALAPAAPTSWTRAGYVPPVFRDGSSGHGGMGLVRDDSTLAIVVLTSHDDQSVPDIGLWSDDPRYNAIGLTARTVAFPDHTYPIARYVDGLLGLRTSPERLFFGVMAGIPDGSDGMEVSAILAMPRMVPQLDAMNDVVVPVCTAPANPQEVAARPAQRIVEVAAGLECAGAEIVVRSICTANFQGTFAAMLGAVGGRPSQRTCVH